MHGYVDHVTAGSLRLEFLLLWVVDFDIKQTLMTVTLVNNSNYSKQV